MNGREVGINFQYFRNIFWCWEDNFIGLFKMLIIHVNVVVSFEAVVDRAVVVHIWIIRIDVLLRDIGLVIDIDFIASPSDPVNLIVELRWCQF